MHFFVKHDHENHEITVKEQARLTMLMNQKTEEVGCGSTVTELRSGEKVIQDASLMFRGKVIVL